MNLARVLLTALVLAALGAYIYLVELPRSEQEQAKKRVLDFTTADVTSIVLDYPDRDAIHLEKDSADQWQITQPIAARADPTAVTNLLNTLLDSDVTRTLDETEDDRAIYGLDKPVVSVVLALKDGGSLPAIEIGKDTPVGFSVFVRRQNDDRILLTRQALRIGMTKQVKDLRDRAIVRVNANDVTGVELTSPTANIVLQKADASWTMQAPLTAKADASRVEVLLANLGSMRAQDFIEQPLLELKEFGLDPPQLRVTVTVDEGEAPSSILVGGERTTDGGAPQRYVKREGQETLYLVRSDILADLDKGVDELRDKTLVELKPDVVKTVVVLRQDAEGFTLSRGPDGAWAIDPTLPGTLKPGALNQFVSDAAGVVGYEIVADDPEDPGVYGLDTPTLTLRLQGDAGDSLATLLIARRMEEEVERVYARTERDTTVIALRDYVYERLNKTAADFWQPPVEEETTTDANNGAPPGGQPEAADAAPVS